MLHALIHLIHSITTLLDINLFVVVLALDFSKAFDSVRYSAVLGKYAYMSIPDNIYNWIASFFRDHSHITKYGNEVSQSRTISASIIQGSGIGPPYVVTASDLHSVVSGNGMSKYADDTYVIIPADNLQSCQEEIANVESWANHNNLKLNHAVSRNNLRSSQK